MPISISHLRFIWPPLCLAFLSCASALAYTKSGTTYTTDGSQSDVSAAIANATAGDTVNIPAGSFTWGASASYLTVNKVITLSGAGTSNTTINISSTAGTYTAAVIRITAAATVKDFTIVGATGAKSVFSTSTANGWRITNITYSGVSGEGYFCYAGNYGLIDNCTITGGGGSSELIFTRGPTDSWQTASSIGTANAVYIESCTFNGHGYVSDFNSNARGVVRFCTINGQIKIDAHGKASNTPPRGARHTEVYGNTWTTNSGYWPAIELRGGTGMVFDNSAASTSGTTRFLLREYGATGQWSNFGSIYQTPINYPIDDQIGVGVDPKAGGSEPMYLWNNKIGGSDWAPTEGTPIPKGAIDLYRTQTGNPTATFTMLGDIIVADRDYFKHTVGGSFTGAGGVGRGTRAQMDAITPTKTGVGFWVTDEGSWDTTKAANTSGQLYRWNGSAWALHYTPYTYPHPARRPGVPSNVRIRQG